MEATIHLTRAVSPETVPVEAPCKEMAVSHPTTPVDFTQLLSYFYLLRGHKLEGSVTEQAQSSA